MMGLAPGAVNNFQAMTVPTMQCNRPMLSVSWKTLSVEMCRGKIQNYTIDILVRRNNPHSVEVSGILEMK